MWVLTAERSTGVRVCELTACRLYTPTEILRCNEAGGARPCVVLWAQARLGASCTYKGNANYDAAGPLTTPFSLAQDAHRK